MSYISASARVAAIISRLADPAAAVTRSVAPTATTPLDRLAAVATTPTIPAADPLPGARRTQGFGNSGFHMAPAASRDGVRYPHYHAGVDLSAAEGTPVRAIAGGEVTFAATPTVRSRSMVTLRSARQSASAKRSKRGRPLVASA
jgi:murein DD-endopeptidase MepM/ murein hydrolase activator NlpD